jgi:hypothetical protein
MVALDTRALGGAPAKHASLLLVKIKCTTKKVFLALATCLTDQPEQFFNAYLSYLMSSFLRRYVSDEQ